MSQGGGQMEAEFIMRWKHEIPMMEEASFQGDCFGIERGNYVAPTGTGLELAISEIERQGNAGTVSRRSQGTCSNTLRQNRDTRPCQLNVRKSHLTKHKVSTFEEPGKVPSVPAFGGSQPVRQSFEITRGSTNMGKNGPEIERVSNFEIETSVNEHIEGQGIVTSIEGQGIVTGCSSCFGRVITSTRRFPGEGSLLSGCASSGTVSHGLRCRKGSAVGYALGKSLGRHSLRNFSCISSGDVVPSVRNTGTISAPSPVSNRQKLGDYRTRQRNAAPNGLRSSKRFVVSSAESVVRRNLQIGLQASLSEQDAADVHPLPARSLRASTPAFKTSKWCLMRPTSINSDTMVSSSTRARVNSALQPPTAGHRGGGREISRISIEPHEIAPRATVVEGELSSEWPVGNANRDLGLSGRHLGALEADRRNTTRLWVDSGLSSTTSSFRHDGHNESSSIFSGPPSTSRISPVPSLFQMSQRTRSLEVFSSSSSYTSSPDVQFSNSGMLHSYVSTFESPNISRTVSSPERHEGYHVQSEETPVYRSFRHLPLRFFEEDRVCFTFEGPSEFLSARERVERDEISYEQVYMLEANLLLGGMASHDQHRDMRLDVDNMSYEELLALEETIGNVCTGLSKDAISRCLKRKKYLFTDMLANCIRQDSEIKCSICQDEFEEGVELGILECGHNHHFTCIEEWLLQKNQCPICKASASS